MSPPRGSALTAIIASVEATAGREESRTAFILVGVLRLSFCFLQFALRSAPLAMIQELAAAFGLTTPAVSAS